MASGSEASVRHADASVIDSDSGSGSRVPARAGRSVWALRTVALVPVVAYVVVALQRVGYPYELSFFEGSTVEVAARVFAGEPLYGPPTTDFTPWPYPPLYFWVTGELFHVTGVSVITMRVVSLLASLAAMAMLGLIVRRLTGSGTAGLVAAGLFAATYRVSDLWFDTARVDSLLIALLLAAVLLGLHARGRWGGAGVGVLLVAAFLTKQNALIVAVPMVAWLLVRRPRVGRTTAAVVVAGALASVVVGDLVTDGWYSRYTVLQLLGHGVVSRWLAMFWVVDLLLPFAIVVAALAWLLRPYRIPRALGSRAPGSDASFVLAAVAGLWLAALAGRLHEGGSANVAIPAHAGMALLVGLGAAAALRAGPGSGAGRRSAAAVLAVAVGAQAVLLVLWHPRAVPTAADRAAGDRLVARLAELPGEVVVPSHPYYLRLAGRPVHASAIAVTDLLATRPGPARAAMELALPWSLDGVSAVVLDAPDDAALFGPALSREFTLVSSALVSGDDLIPVADAATRPTLLYVRSTLLPVVSGEAS